MLNKSQVNFPPKKLHKDLNVYPLLSNTARRQPNKVGGKSKKRYVAITTEGVNFNLTYLLT